MAWGDGGFSTVRKLLRTTSARQGPKLRRANFRPTFETLETRDTPSTVTIAQLQNGSEQGTNGIFRVTRDDTSGNLWVNYTVDTVNSSAVHGTDFSILSGSVMIADGNAYADIPIVPVSDSEVEGEEDVTVVLAPGGGCCCCCGGGAYTIGSPSSATLTIADDDLEITASNVTMVYGDSVTLTGFTSNGLHGSETIGSVTLTTNATLSASGNWNVGTWTITASAATGGTFDPNDYSITYFTGTLTVTAKPLTITGLAVDTKVYDYTTSATIDSDGAALISVESGDDVELFGVYGSFDDKNVDDEVPVTLDYAYIGGDDAFNYTVTLPTGLTGEITPATLTIYGLIAEDKVYDATTAATLDDTDAGLMGVFGDDDVTWDLSTATATFAEPDVALGVEVTVSGISLTGADAGNYTLMQPTGLAADITLEITATPVDFNAVANVDTGSILIATFTVSGACPDAEIFDVTIYWGDGTVTEDAESVVLNGSVYEVYGSHTYTQAGLGECTVTITDPVGDSATAYPIATISGGVLTVNPGSPLFLQVNQLGSNLAVATFSDTDPSASAGNYEAWIDWGDGDFSQGTINPQGSSFFVAGDHTYTAIGTYTVSVTVYGTHGEQTVTLTATVTSAPISGTDATGVSGTQGFPMLDKVIATFTNTDPTLTMDSFSANINWGDSSSLAGIIEAAGGGTYRVRGSHTYMTPGTFNITVTVTKFGETTTTTINTNATIARPPVFVQVAGLDGMEGKALDNQVIGTFISLDPGDSYSAYSATINWGDDSAPSPGTLGDVGGQFTITGSHTYAVQGMYQVTISLTRAEMAPVTAISAAAIENAPITMDAPDDPLSFAEQEELDNVVIATFTDENPLTDATEYVATVQWGDSDDEAETAIVQAVAGQPGKFEIRGRTPMPSLATTSFKSRSATRWGAATEPRRPSRSMMPS